MRQYRLIKFISVVVMHLLTRCLIYYTVLYYTLILYTIHSYYTYTLILYTAYSIGGMVRLKYPIKTGPKF